MPVHPLVVFGLAVVATAPADPAPVVVKFGALSATAPADWACEKPSNLLRSYQFKLPSADTTLPAAEVAVYKEGSPKVDAKFAEWKATFVPPDGKPIDDFTKTAKWDLPGGATAHVLDVSGTWKYRERPRDPKSKEEIKPDYRVVWVILTEADACHHVRLSGPDEVVKKRYPQFEAWVKSAR